jgi:hypothetical protein
LGEEGLGRLPAEGAALAAAVIGVIGGIAAVDAE